MSALGGIHHVQLAAPAGSERRSRWFYGTVLGLDEVAKPPALAARLRSYGVEVRWDEDFPGYRRCYVDDPHGNRLELLEPV